MLIKIALAFILLLFNIGDVRAQYFESVEKEAERILISLSEGDSLEPSELNELNNLISSEITVEVSKSYPDVNQKNIDSLKNHLIEFETEIKNIPTDSIFVLFNDWYLHLQNIFYDYSKQKFFSLTRVKILFFSTSMSCDCTLEMGRKQTAELIKFISENDDKYDCWIVDSYWYNELQIKNEAFFAPSVLVFNGKNQLLYKIEYDEKMMALLSDYLTGLNN